MRSKTIWYNKGEKTTKYFLSLEKRHFKQNTLNQVKSGDNTFVTSDEDILAGRMSFYENLYESKGATSTSLDDSFFFNGENDTVLKGYEQNACEVLLTGIECL